jgi:uncharacterized protein (TIGR02270 family)
MEVHLEEASFLWGQWEQALWAPDDVLPEVEQGTERRLMAHLDALVLGGRPVAERLLLPALEGEEVASISAAAFALLGAEDVDWQQQVLEWLTEGAEEVVDGIRRGVELSPRESLGPALLRALPDVPVERQACVLAALDFQKADVSQVLRGLRLKDDTALRAQAVRAARFASQPLAEELIRLGLDDGELSVLDAALGAGLVVGSRRAWSRCRQLLEAGGEVPRTALLALAVGTEGGELEALLKALEDPGLREEALWALGFSGRLAAADAAFQILEHAGDRLAAESFAAITGLPLEPPFIAEEEAPSEEPLDEEFHLDDEAGSPEEEAPAPEASPPQWLPGPAVLPGAVLVEPVRRWWKEARQRFDAKGRYLRGQPLTEAGLRSALETEPMRRRPALLWEVAIRSRGATQVEPRTWTRVQRRQLQALASLSPELLRRPFDRLFGT